MTVSIDYRIDNRRKNYKYSYSSGDAKNPTSGETPEQQDKNRDDLIKKGGWITPMEYYNNHMVGSASESQQEGFFSYMMQQENVKYFWVNDLCNWCTYVIYGYNNSYSKIFQLCVWNGRDNWIPIDQHFIIPDRYDLYGIAGVQGDILTNCGSKITQYRGICQSLYTTLDSDSFAFNPRYKQNASYLQSIEAFRLKHSTKYTINTGSFQTIAYSTAYTDLNEIAGNTGYTAYIQSYFRSPITIGIPPVWRLPTGEIALCSRLEWNSDTGFPYYYKKRIGDSGFKKYSIAFWTDESRLNKALGFYGIVEFDRIIDSDSVKGAAWINDLCIKFFGGGTDKTITEDWLREYNPSVSMEDYSITDASRISMLDSNLSFEQHDINKENSLTCGFRIMRPLMTTGETEELDYAQKW